ncbi:MAG: sigma-70 family RNA polymerase sigma factor [Bacteroidales bacterium]|nr:sigma-70 family RNA polymerase sigma factor [Bacteroidales bacterium]
MRVVQKDKITDDIVDGILNNDNNIIVMIYKNYQNSIRKLVSNFGRLKLDADDVFQEGLSRAIVNIRNGKFMGDSSFHSYFYAICRNICLKEISKTMNETDMGYEQAGEEDEDREWDMISLMLDLRGQIDKPCREIIDLRFNINRAYSGHERLTPFDYIAEALNIQADNARQRFRRCMAKLSELFMNHPRYKEAIA